MAKAFHTPSKLSIISELRQADYSQGTPDRGIKMYVDMANLLMATSMIILIAE